MEFKSKIAGITALCLAFTAGAAVSPRLTRAAGMFGDINGDSHVDAKDASIILSYYSYLSTTDGEPVALEEYVSNGGKAPATTTPAVTTTAETTTTAATTTTTAATTTTTSITDDDYEANYGYYDELAKEYEKSGASVFRYDELLIIDENCKPLNLGNKNVRVLYSEGKFGFIRKCKGKNDVLVTYDINTKSTTERELHSNKNKYYVIGLKFYSFTSSGVSDASRSYYVDVYDFIDESFNNYYSSFRGDYVILPSGEKIDAPTYTIINEHGIEKEIKTLYRSAYENKCFSTIEYEDANNSLHDLMCYDIEKQEWHKIDVPGPEWNKSGYVAQTSDFLTCGKYLMIEYTRANSDYWTYIFDMDTEEFIGNYIATKSTSYYGGKKHTSVYSYAMYPVNGKEVLYNKRINYENGETGQSVLLVNEKYYLKIDEDGVFLRTYEDGAKSEQVIYLVTQN